MNDQLSPDELLDVAIQLVELYAQCSQLNPDIQRYLRFRDANKRKFRQQIFEVLMDQIVFLHDHVTTTYDWTQLAHRLLLSSMVSSQQTQHATANKLFQVLKSLYPSVPSTSSPSSIQVTPPSRVSSSSSSHDSDSSSSEESDVSSPSPSIRVESDINISLPSGVKTDSETETASEQEEESSASYPIPSIGLESE